MEGQFRTTRVQQKNAELQEKIAKDAKIQERFELLVKAGALHPNATVADFNSLSIKWLSEILKCESVGQIFTYIAEIRGLLHQKEKKHLQQLKAMHLPPLFAALGDDNEHKTEYKLESDEVEVEF